MVSDLIPIRYIPRVRALGFKGCPTFYRVFKYFRKKWGYTCWVAQSEKAFIYNIYNRGVYCRPKGSTSFPHCKTYEEADSKLLEEYILIIKEIEF